MSKVFCVCLVLLILTLTIPTSGEIERECCEPCTFKKDGMTINYKLCCSGDICIAGGGSVTCKNYVPCGPGCWYTETVILECGKPFQQQP
jgi:hypothetical protein